MIVISVNALFLMQRERNGMAKAFLHGYIILR